ncbi:hypothetical protein D0859_05995 [Hortaea werneckii]|uniref:Uncharacterized protein n=1 Tax=Hortaea werneckii TaxID=91943 RepID=A0A3M7IWK9_HORWE|nr:hypothetical protein D0859_05995 [Hortaea werneckii]
MDVSAFEVDAKDAITFAELFSSIPPPIRRLITKTLSVGVHIANIFILLAALAGCAAAYCLALAWIYTLRVQSRLLVLNAALLRTAFHQTAPDQDVRVQPPAAQTVPQDVRPAEDACQDQTQPKFNKATAAPLTRGTGQPQEEVLRETNLAGTGNVAHDGMGKSPDKDYLSLRRQVEQDVALNGATVGRSVPLGTHQAPVSWPEGGPLSQANLPNDQFTRLTEVDDNADAHNEWLERVDATPPSAVFDAEPPLKASGLRNVDATPSLHGSAEALSAARAFKNGATKAGNKDRGFGHPKSRSATSHTSNTSTARNDRKTAQFIGSVRSNAGRANAPPGLPRAAASTIRPSSATWLLPGQLPPHMLAAKEARERRSGIQHAKDTDKLTAKAILPPPPAVASKNRYDALSQDSLTSEPTAMSSASFTLTEESSIENEQMRSMESGLHFDSYEELLPEVLSKNNTSFERDPKEDSRIFSIETLKSFDTPLARDSLEDSACALCQRSLLQPSSVQKDVCSNCCSVIDTIDDARAVIEDYNLHDQRQSFKGEEADSRYKYCNVMVLTRCLGVPKHDKQWIAPSKETENTFTQETLPSSPSEKTSSSLSPKAPPFFVPSRKQSNVTATGSKSGVNEQMQRTRCQNTFNTSTASASYGRSAQLYDLYGWNHAVNAHYENLAPPQPSQVYPYSSPRLGEMDLSVHHGVPDAMVSPSAQHQSPYGDLVTSLEASFTTRPISQAIPASLTTRSSSQAIPIIAPVSSEPDSRLGLRPIPKTSVDVAIAHLENYTTSDGCANSFQGATGGQESPATKSLSPSVALNSETGRKHPDSVARSAQHRGTENEPVVRGLTMQDHAVSGFRKELEDPLISFQSSEEILRPEDTHSQFKHILGESTGSAETVGPGNDRLNTAEDAADTESEPQGDQCETISASREPSKNKSTNKIAQKERRQRRKILRDELLMAWCTRERARKRVAGGFSLERYKTLEDATRAYHAKREELQKASPEGELNEDDALMFPKMPVNDVSSPQRWPRGANETLRAQQEQARQSEEKEESLDPAAASSSDEDLSELKQQALKALQNFRNAEASVKYPAPQGRAKMRQLKEDARAKLKRARQWYVRKRKEVVDKDPDDPSLVDELPWVAEHV